MMTATAGLRAFRTRNATRRLGLLWLALATGAVGADLAMAETSARIFTAALPDMEWQIGPPVVAPWADAADVSPATGLVNRRVRLSTSGIEAPAPLACGHPHYEYVVSPAEGLFQGLLPPPAEQGARRLGIVQLPVLTLRVTCASGVFDYHLVSEMKALLGLDNAIWPLVRRDDKTTPEHVVVTLFQSHLTHDMAFTAVSVAQKHAFLTDGLRKAITAYFRRPMPQDAVPPIDGDPFTDTQEYPTRFAPGRASIAGRRALMPIRFGEGATSRVLHVQLLRFGQHWRVDNLRYADGSTLRGRLQPLPQHSP